MRHRTYVGLADVLAEKIVLVFLYLNGPWTTGKNKSWVRRAQMVSACG